MTEGGRLGQGWMMSLVGRHGEDAGVLETRHRPDLASLQQENCIPATLSLKSTSQCPEHSLCDTFKGSRSSWGRISVGWCSSSEHQGALLQVCIPVRREAPHLHEPPPCPPYAPLKGEKQPSAPEKTAAPSPAPHPTPRGLSTPGPVSSALLSSRMPLGPSRCFLLL